MGMTRDKAIEEVKNYENHPNGLSKECRDYIIKALEQIPTTKNDLAVDCINRADAIRVASGYCHPSNVAKELAKLPSVKPIRPKGHWIYKQRLLDSCSAECSACHNRSNGYVYDNGFSLECKYYDFCPNCGADMRGSENECNS